VSLASWWSPSTDAGVFVQVAITIVIAMVLGVAARREPALVWLIAGVTMVILGWYGIRGLH